MGAIAAWIAEHARQVVAWGIFLAAIVALAAAVQRSGVYETFTNAQNSIRDRITKILDYPSDIVATLNSVAQTAANEDSSGWVRVIFYAVNLDGISRAFRLISENFRTLCVTMLALWAVVWKVLLACFAYSRGVALARWMSNGSLPTET